jgi:RNA polymerase sigma-70 factor (ECF subfamily)
VLHSKPPFHVPSPSASVSAQAARQNAAAGPDIRPVFEALYRSHCSPLRRVAFNWVGDFHDAEDAVQEAFLRAYRNAPSFAGQSTLSTWLYRILINVCHDVGRGRRRLLANRAMSAESQELQHRPAVTEDPMLRVFLEKMLRRLSPRHSSILLLFEVEGLKHSEIAAMLRITEGASKTRLSQAKKQLRRMLSKSRPSPYSSFSSVPRLAD